MTTDLAERYGAPSPVRRRLALGALVLVVVALAGWLGWTALFHASPPVESQLVAYDIVDENRATAVLSVSVYRRCMFGTMPSNACFHSQWLPFFLLS